MAQQIIVTKDNYGIGLSCNFIDKNKNPIDLTDKVVEVVIVDSNNETIDIKQAVIVDYTNAKASIVLEKIHTSTLGLHKTFWSVLDDNQNITAQEDVYYYVKDKNNGSEGNVDSGFDVEDVFKNLEDRLEESEDSLKELKERTNYLNEQLDNIVKNIEDFGAIGDNNTDNTVAFQSALNSKYNKFKLKDNCLYKVGQLTIPNDKIVEFYGNNGCGLVYIGEKNTNLFLKGNDNSRLKLEGVLLSGVTQQNVTNAIMVDNQTLERKSFYNNKESGTILDIAHFGGQGTTNYPIGVIIHSYTDGRPMQIDGVGLAPSILALKNGHNPKRRSDKEPTFVGQSAFLDCLQHNLTTGGEDRLMQITKDGNIWWTTVKTDTVNFSSGKQDDVNPTFQFQTLQYNQKPFAIKQAYNEIFQILNDMDGRRLVLVSTPINTLGMRIESKKGEVVIKSETNTMIDMQNALRMKPIQQTSIPTTEKNILFLDATSGKLCFKDIHGTIHELY